MRTALMAFRHEARAYSSNTQPRVSPLGNSNHYVVKKWMVLIGIQMLSKTLHEQMFGKEVNNHSPEAARAANVSIEHLKTHRLWGREETLRPEVELDLPPLKGNNIAEHFKLIAKEQLEPYLSHLHLLLNSELPRPPDQWLYQEGWTKYDCHGPVPIPYPDTDVMVLDIEVCVSEGIGLGLAYS